MKYQHPHHLAKFLCITAWPLLLVSGLFAAPGMAKAEPEREQRAEPELVTEDLRSWTISVDVRSITWTGETLPMPGVSARFHPSERFSTGLFVGTMPYLSAAGIDQRVYFLTGDLKPYLYARAGVAVDEFGHAILAGGGVGFEHIWDNGFSLYAQSGADYVMYEAMPSDVNLALDVGIGYHF